MPELSDREKAARSFAIGMVSGGPEEVRKYILEVVVRSFEAGANWDHAQWTKMIKELTGE